MFALVLLTAALVLGVQDSTTAGIITGPTSALGALFAAGGALATSAILGGVKNLDSQIVRSTVFRKVQPVITLGGALLAPLIAAKLGVQADPSQWSAAPLATVFTLVIAEGIGALKRSV